MHNRIIDLLGQVNQEDIIHYDYISNRLWKIINLIFQETENLSPKNKSEIIDFFYIKIREDNPIKSILYYSLIVNLTDDEKDFISCIEYVHHGTRFTLYEKYYLYYQISALCFRRIKTDNPSLTITRWKLFSNIIDGYKKLLTDNLEYISPSERDSSFIIVLTEQYTEVQHAPSKTALDRCFTLMNDFKKNVLLVNTAEMLSQTGSIPFVGSLMGRYVPSLSEKEFIDWKGKSIPYYQMDVGAPDDASIRTILEFVKKRKPYFIVQIGTGSVICSVLSQILPVISVATNFRTLSPTETTYQTLGKAIDSNDSFILKEIGKDETHVIEGLFTFGLKSQTQTFSRESMGLPENAFICCVIGIRLDSDIDRDFLSMMEHVLDVAEKEIFLVFAGIFTRNDLIEEYSRLKKHFIYAGNMSDIFAFLDNCDLYVNPRRIGGGTSAVEAMSKGLPVITQAFGDVYAVVGEEFAVQNYTEMADHILKYASDISFYNDRSMKAKIRAEKVMDTETAFSEIIQEMAKRENLYL